jgi:hypothetical protein
MRKTAIVVLGMALCIALPGHGIAQEATIGSAAAVDTLKERLSDKASDPQRVNDCKVPLEKRDDPRRPATCGLAAQSGDEQGDESAGRSLDEASPGESE